MCSEILRNAERYRGCGLTKVVAWRMGEKVGRKKWLFNIEALQDDFGPDIQTT